MARSHGHVHSSAPNVFM